MSVIRDDEGELPPTRSFNCERRCCVSYLTHFPPHWRISVWDTQPLWYHCGPSPAPAHTHPSTGWGGGGGGGGGGEGGRSSHFRQGNTTAVSLPAEQSCCPCESPGSVVLFSLRREASGQPGEVRKRGRGGG